MAKRHDENKDLMAISRIGKILYGDKSIVINKSSIVGIKMLGRLDYLIHYCGWHLVWSNKVFVSNGKLSSDDDKPKARITKKLSKQPKLSDKTNKKKK